MASQRRTLVSYFVVTKAESVLEGAPHKKLTSPEFARTSFPKHGKEDFSKSHFHRLSPLLSHMISLMNPSP